ncbi:MAG: rhodanese-like domain-containing protein [Vampirovibrionales bacterium]
MTSPEAMQTKPSLMIAPTQVAPEAYHTIIDVRSLQEFLPEHIPESRNIPLETLSAQGSLLREYPHIILSCASGKRALQAYEQLQAMGFTQVSILEGSLAGWKQARLKTISLRRGFSVMQQVQLLVGMMILIGVYYPPLKLLVPIAGVGLLMAGLTNTCMMANVLARMPWNQSSAQQTCRLDTPKPVKKTGSCCH